MGPLHVQHKDTVELLLLSSVQPLPATLKFWVPARLPSSPVAPLLMLRLVDMRLQLACNAHTKAHQHLHVDLLTPFALSSSPTPACSL